MGYPSRRMLGFSRELRRRATPEERIPWSHLRRHQLGWIMRRQHVVGPFIVDFYCPAARLAIELDGRFHVAQHDEIRDIDLMMLDVEVLRFENHEVRDDLARVLDALRRAIRRRVAAHQGLDAAGDPRAPRTTSTPSPGTGEGAGGEGINGTEPPRTRTAP